MGNIRRIRRSINPKIAMADAHMAVNGCRVYLGHPNPSKAAEAAKGFKGFLSSVVVRASYPSVYDILGASFSIRGKMESGNWN